MRLSILWAFVLLLVLVVAPLWAQTTIETDGDVEAQGFVGDGSQLTAVDAELLDGMDSLAFAQDSDLQNVETMLTELQGQVDGLWTNVQAFGATGDGGTDDTAAIQDAINSATTGGWVVFPAPTSYYLVSGTLDIDKALTLYGQGAEISLATDDTTLFDVTASDVTIRGLRLVGPQYTSKANNARAIDAHGVSALSPIHMVRLVDNEIDSWGFYGIHLEHVHDFEVRGNQITNIYYAAVLGASVIEGVISDNNIDTVVGLPNSYGIALSRRESDDLDAYPRSSDVVVSRNTVRNIPNWEGLDTHGGQRITFSDNLVEKARIGITVGSADGDGQTPLFAPLDVIVVDNVIDSSVTDGSAYVGINFVGAAGVTGASAESATGVIQGNVIRGYGDEANGLSAAIYARDTQGLVISGNSILEPSPNGINIYHDNYGFTVVGNTIVDPWTETRSEGVGIVFRSGFNEGVVSSNSLVRHDKTASVVLNRGIRIADSETNKVVVGENRSEADLYLYDPGDRLLPTHAGSLANTPGKVVCVTDGGNLGTCTSAVPADGSCTCG